MPNNTSKEEMKLNEEKLKNYEPSQFKKGHEPPIQHDTAPGLEKDMNPRPVYNKLPTADGGYELYKAAGKLAGKKALITGGDSGIGRAIAVLFAMEGADSAITYLPQEIEDAQETKKLVEGCGAKCFLFEADISTAQACRKLVDDVLKQMGRVNVLVNNAAYQMEVESITDLSEEQWDYTFKTNVYSFFWISKYIVPQLKSGDTIINNASINHYIGKPNLLDYSSTKGAIVAFTRALSNQLCGKGIRVNCVAPGPVWTPLVISTMTTEDLDSFGSTPMGRPGQPSEIATCFVFLASSDSSMISGQTLHPNGGSIING
ncbi:hypothetical protein BZA05DRAFT_385337 [Tricharina praecox]|uniref:uncharacterized protein n=1 Tax=Tricharina praecox TaxID=43433 RepID=UPI00221F5CCB|nr:uncharacterized protein BZA05DRAFT_385337 [Tricharina praecox]KAI5857941.1 hypothetical protein BZA05DRAFT_385337 [Tricharina praecox]